MFRTSNLRTLRLLLALSTLALAADGFYKDLFMDGGTGLTHRTRLYAAESLALSYEYLAKDDSALLRRIVIASPEDSNGYLLYPEGAPRFRLIYTNGGDAGAHGAMMGDSGRQRIRDFFSHGGSYSGSCAGAYLASLSNQDSGTSPFFYHLWPGRTKDTRIADAYVGNFVPLTSPLLRYDSFGGDFYIDSLYVYGGPFANESINWPPATEVLLRYDTAGYFCDSTVSAWAYKAADSTGRCALLGTHPEGWPFGEWLDLTKAVFQYALDGIGSPRLKAMLENGVTRQMNQRWRGDPAFACIGDKQYHHFACDPPSPARNLSVSLSASDSFHLNLFLKRDTFAFRSNADYSDTSPGAHKTILVPSPGSGRWYIGVELANTVTTYGDSCFLYTDSLQVLNGVPYSITATWDTTGAIAEGRPSPFAYRHSPSATILRDRFLILQPANCNLQTDLALLDASGCRVLRLHAGTNDVSSLPPGVYFVRGPSAVIKVVLTR